ncbi:MAG: TolC family outer membrane protein [Woeseiaceae bacterium]|nr:TolC family outer membrane protein [Woeseiaceae bacterium]
MKKFKSIIALLLTCAFAAPLTASAESLLEVYQQALQSDPRIFEAEARRLAALEAEPQARGLYLPQIDFSGSYTSDTSDGSGVTQQAILDDSTSPPTVVDVVPVQFQSRTESDTTRWQFQLRQTIFRWDQIVGMRRADKTVARAEADREAAQQDLIVRVTQRYFDVLAAEDRLAATIANRRAIARQLEQAKQRFDVGLIAITDVQESQARYDSAVADEIAAKRALATAEYFLQEITGDPVGPLSAPSSELPLNSPEPTSEQSWVDLALDQNLALVASRIDERLARDEISFRRNGHYPTIDLVASTSNTDVTSEQDTFTGLGPLPADRDFDADSISIQFNLPLFAGGRTTSRVKEAVYLHRASREVLQRTTRETERAARDAYLGVLAEISRVSALERAVESNQTALEATQAGYDVGTRTIVEVLNAQFQLYQAVTNYYQSRYDYILNVMRLKQAAGTLQIQDLERLEPFLEVRDDPETRAESEGESE